jgi:uncharacterized membrane protein YkoI
MKISIAALRRPLALAAVTAASFTLVACGSNEPATAPAPAATTSTSAPAEPAPTATVTVTPSDSPSESASESASPSADRKGNDALVAAGRLGLKEVSGGTVSSIESEGSGWEVHVVTSNGEEKQLRTNAAGTRVVAGPANDPADAEDRAENQQFARADINFREAVEAIEGEIDGGVVNELSMDRDIGRTLWEADVTAGSENRSVEVDADNGKIVSNRIDD